MSWLCPASRPVTIDTGLQQPSKTLKVGKERLFPKWGAQYECLDTANIKDRFLTRLLYKYNADHKTSRNKLLNELSSQPKSRKYDETYLAFCFVIVKHLQMFN